MRTTVSAGLDGLRACFAAFQFLTRIPIPVHIEYSEDMCRRSVVFYPIVGLVIGLLLALWGALFDWVLPGLVRGVLLTALWVVLSGGLHLDGLMDTADGLLSHRSKEKMLEIMKDSRVGAMGVIVAVLYLLLKTALIVSIMEGSQVEFSIWLILIPVWSRTFIVTAIARWPYVRQGAGLGLLFRLVGKREAVLALLGACLISVAVPAFLGGWTWTEAALLTAFMVFVSFAIGTMISVNITRKLGGLTGDVYGALNECIEVGLLMIFVAYSYNF